ncbi:MAG: hypothetical protein CMJ23_11680 [Phycisphaerae bacterium]|nr:hypothetical protein [Phycisphaerae bacterium]
MPAGEKRPNGGKGANRQQFRRGVTEPDLVLASPATKHFSTARAGGPQRRAEGSQGCESSEAHPAGCEIDHGAGGNQSGSGSGGPEAGSFQTRGTREVDTAERLHDLERGCGGFVTGEAETRCDHRPAFRFTFSGSGQKALNAVVEGFASRDLRVFRSGIG